MSIAFEKRDDIGMASVADEMTIYSAAEHKKALLDHLADCHVLEIDLSGVSELDGAGLQILLMLKIEARRMGRVLRLIKHSPAVLEVIELLNAAAYFGDPVVIPAQRGGS